MFVTIDRDISNPGRLGFGTTPDLYEVQVDGFDMFPRYRPGETLWIDPGRTIKAGDDVLVTLAMGRNKTPCRTIREFVSWENNELVVTRGHAVAECYTRADIISVHRVMYSCP